MRDKLTIGEFNDSFMPVMDGVVNVLNNYTIELNRLGHHAYAIVPGYSDEPDYDREHGITYAIRGKEHYPLKSLRPYGITTFPHDVRKEIESIPFDIVHAHCPTFSGEFALKLSREKNIPLVSTFHTFFKDDLKELVPDFLAEQIVKMRMSFYYKCDEVWTPSEASRRKMQTEYYYTGEIRVVENCADFVPPKDDEEFEERKRRGRELCGVHDDTPILLFVGQHKDEKNIPLTLETIKELKARGLRFRMVFVGEGHRKQYYEEYVRDNNLSDSVTFLGRFTDRDKLADVYASGYLFLFPSLYDVSCVVMREAAAFSLPLVFAEGSCTSEGVIDGENGFLVECNVKDYADKLEYLLNHPEVRNHAGDGARKTIYRSWGDVTKKVEELYYEIIENKKRKKTAK
jgi:1,2-diacylglycerol 3-alpha-glucosyltransferase